MLPPADAICHLVGNGIKGRETPADFPPWDRVYAFVRRWGDHALVKGDRDLLRARVRTRRGGTEPTAGVIDSHSVRRTPSSAPTAPASTAAS
ncbi:hypothetical protein [Streptomyces fagopyri]|uniref:hypothetical protein n=1 Tax=Streptomyces fagopyri TaxID=2662397 RepID=UPI0033FB7203